MKKQNLSLLSISTLLGILPFMSVSCSQSQNSNSTANDSAGGEMVLIEEVSENNNYSYENNYDSYNGVEGQVAPTDGVPDDFFDENEEMPEIPEHVDDFDEYVIK